MHIFALEIKGQPQAVLFKNLVARSRADFKLPQATMHALISNPGPGFKSCTSYETDLCCLVRIIIGKVPVYHAIGSGSITSQTNTQGLKIIEEKVLPL